MSDTINNLFGGAVNTGAVSQTTLEAIQVEDLGAQIQAGLGINVDEVKASEVVLVSIMPDDSGSIGVIREDPRDYKSKIVGPSLIRDGHNLVIDSLLGTKKEQTDAILIHNRYLNGQVLYPYTTLDKAVRMDTNNYDPDQGTPLYDQATVLLATVLVKAMEFENNGVACRTITLIISDGRDEHSPKNRGGRGTTASDVRKLVQDMLLSEQHIIAAMGIGDPGVFRDVFSEMGIEDRWILTPGNSQSEIRKAFQVFSQSAVRASQNAGSFSQTAIGGFGN